MRIFKKSSRREGKAFLKESEAGRYVPEYLRGLVGEIMRAHNLTPKSIKTELPDVAAIGRNNSNPQALSLILCCADALEFSDTRVIDSAYREAERRKDDAAIKSLLEMRKHNSIRCGLAVNPQGFIFVTGDFEDADVLHTTHITLDQIEGWLKEYILFNQQLKRQVLRIVNPIISRTFTTSGFEYFPVALKIDEYQIRNLLSSKKVWGNEDGKSIIELVQNSVDACRYKMHISPPAVSYEPRVKIIVDFNERTITVKDNGIGMDCHDITNFFLQLGSSKTRDSVFISDKNQGFHSIARFGVGFWSVFSFAEIASVRTKLSDYYSNVGGVAFNVTVEPVMRFLELKQDNSIQGGTEIKLKIGKHVDLSKIIENITSNIIVSLIPITIKNSNGDDIYQFNKKLPEIILQDLFGYRSINAEKEGVKWFSDSYNTDNIEYQIGIAYSIINNEPRCLTPNGDAFFKLRPSKSGFSSTISVCGFRTNMKFGSLPFPTDFMPFAIDRVGIVKVNIKNPEGINYSFDRQELEDTTKLIEIRNEIMKCMSQSLGKFYDFLQVNNNPVKIGNIISDSRKGGGDAGDQIIPNLYRVYEKFYNGLVALPIYYFKKKDKELLIEQKNIFIQDFWKIDTPMMYICIWPDSICLTHIKKTVETKVIQFIKQFITNSGSDSGCILFASKESASVINVASGIAVKSFDFSYEDWNGKSNQYIEIIPSKGFSYSDKILFNLRSKWSGHIIKANFDKSKQNKPWMSFGRYMMFVDIEHELIKKIKSLYDTGQMIKVANLLDLMSSRDESCLDEIRNITGVEVSYKN